ncbi:class I SAM-dependent methyltransferase [Candidatus Parcubacteria bacterium]|nr:class I SAM-dependent methyltransferase [Candidatus Parcubacteria bacterium]
MLDLFVVIWIILFLSFLTIIIYGFPAILSAGPIPAHKKGIGKALELAKIKPGEKFYDLGCGDGRVLVKAVKKYDCYGVGYELVFPYYLLAKARAKLYGKSDKIDMKCKNFFKADLQNADVIFCFLTPRLMQKIGKLLKETEIKKGARLVSYGFSIKDMEPVEKIKHSKENWNIYLYKI